MINKTYSTPIPSMIDDEHLSTMSEGSQPPGIPSRLGSFASSCKLFEILADILSSFYSGIHDTDAEPSVPDMISEVLTYNRRLDSFIASIPEYLKTKHSPVVVVSEKNTCTNLQQQVLYCR